MSNAETVVRSMIVESPLARLLGMRLEACAPDRVQVRLPFRLDVTTIGNVVHGGAIAGLVDTAATAAAWSGADLEKQSRGTTIGFTVNFLAAGRGQDLVATARVIQRGRVICVCEVEVAGADGTAVARALVTYKLG
jgi:uncharacterized protein (TIGR00369 family)